MMNNAHTHSLTFGPFICRATVTEFPDHVEVSISTEADMKKLNRKKPNLAPPPLDQTGPWLDEILAPYTRDGSRAVHIIDANTGERQIIAA